MAKKPDPRMLGTGGAANTGKAINKRMNRINEAASMIPKRKPKKTK